MSHPTDPLRTKRNVLFGVSLHMLVSFAGLAVAHCRTDCRLRCVRRLACLPRTPCCAGSRGQSRSSATPASRAAHASRTSTSASMKRTGTRHAARAAARASASSRSAPAARSWCPRRCGMWTYACSLTDAPVCDPGTGTEAARRALADAGSAMPQCWCLGPWHAPTPHPFCLLG